MMKGIIHDTQTGEIKEVDLSSEEVASLQSYKQEASARLEEKSKEIEAKKIAKSALLAKLGITEEEAKLLLS